MPELTGDDVAGGLRRLGLAAGAGVMVHSSLRSFGRVRGGAEAVVDALQAVVTARGTLMMPSFNHGKAFAAGAPGFFDPATTPTTNGAIPEAFRRRPDVCRSLHPTHAFAARGACARRYTEHHHRTLTCGPDSPLGMLWRDGGFGLLLGVDYRVNTFHHVVEQTTGAPCLGPRTSAYPMRLPGGRTVEGRSWGWRERGCPITDGRRYGPVMAARGLQVTGRIGPCRATLFRLSDCFEVIAGLLRTGVEGFPPCSDCPIRPRRTGRTVASDWDASAGALRADSPARDY